MPPITRTFDNSNFFLGPLEVRVIGSILYILYLRRFLKYYSYHWRLFSTLKFDSIIVCGGIFGATSNVQYIESILHATTYPIEQDCQWEIRSSVKLVVLTFEQLYFEGDANCKRDYIELSEQISNRKVLIAKICSREHFNKTYYSSVSGMFLHFHTNGNNTYKGFKASFREGELNILLIRLDDVLKLLF